MKWSTHCQVEKDANHYEQYTAIYKGIILKE